ncbi:hypothetical protein [Salinirussus salinus]|jgi:hypothetical protein|uniref:hypothetical protein n=1 Tax=Salinirussus salinus TaxID=1198300 RepID=UPI001357207C|nr:hypothetical protein [Salinirussus salinus]
MCLPSRRSVLCGLGSVAAAGLAGCIEARPNDTSGTANDDLEGSTTFHTSIEVRNEDDRAYTVTAVIRQSGERVREASTLASAGTTREVGVGSLKPGVYTLVVRLDSGERARTGLSVREDSGRDRTVVIDESGEARFP